MISLRLGLLLAGACALTIYGLKGQWSSPEVAFTRPAPAAAANLDLRAPVSMVHVAIPVDLARVGRRVDAAVEQRLALGLSLGTDAVDAACQKRPPTGDCTPLKLDGTLGIAGPSQIVLQGAAVRIAVPLKIEAAERPAQSIPVAFAFSIRPATGTGFSITRIEDNQSEAGTNARISRQLEARLRQVALAAQDELQQVFARLPIATATQRAWSALSQPIQLGLGSGAALVAMPEIAGGAELTSLGGNPVVRIPITTRLAVGPADAFQQAAPKPVITGVLQPGASALVRMATQLRLDGTQQVIAADLTKAGAMETKPDRFGPSVKVVVHGARIYPSVRNIAVELDLSATRYEGQTFRGKAHLVGRPVLEIEQSMVTLADLTFPPSPPREAGNSQLPANAPRLGAEPFASRLAATARIDIGRELSQSIPQAMNLLHQRLGDRLTLSARLDRSQPVGIETNRDGAWLITDLSGDLTLTYEGPQEFAAGGHVPEPVALTAPVGRASTPETTAAAVVSATATATSAAIALRAPAATPATVPPAPATQPAASVREAPPVKPATARASVPKTATAKQATAAGQRKGGAAGSGRRDWVPFASN